MALLMADDASTRRGADIEYPRDDWSPAKENPP